MADYTTTTLLASMRRRAGSPNATAQGTADEDLLLVASEELLGEVTAFLRKVNEDHLLDTVDITIEPGVAEYDLPRRAIAGTLKDAVFLEPDGTQYDLKGMDVKEMPRRYRDSGLPTRYYFRDQTIVLHPVPYLPGTLRLPYFRRRSELVLPNAVGIISGIADKTLTCNAALPDGYIVGAKYDVVQANPPFRILNMDVVADQVGGSTVVFLTDLSDKVEVGDYLCLAGDSPVPQIPRELHQFLAQAAACKLLSGPHGDQEQLGPATAELNRLRDEVLPDLTKDRAPGTETYLANPYFFGEWE